MDDETSYKLNGKIKFLETKTVVFNSIIVDTMAQKTTRKLYFDRNNNLLKEYYSYGNFTDETIYNYNKKGVLESSIATKQNSVSGPLKSKYEYDKNKNCITHKVYGNETLYNIKTSKYDNNNNVIEEDFNYLQNKIYSWRTTYVYDYKKSTCLLKFFDADNKENNATLEFHYDKKGYIININKINSKTKLNAYTSIDYDKFGHSISYLTLDEKKNIKISYVFKNEYDIKGNLIKRETFDNGKLIEKSITNITYW